MTDDLAAARTARVFRAMAESGIDVMVLGGQANTGYASGMRRLWTAGTRPFGPGCVLVASTGGVHVLSSWRAGVPESIPFEHLYGITWNPQKMGESLTAIPGFTEATVIGADGMSPGFGRAIASLVPGAEVVPVDDLMNRVRSVKLPGELALIRAACRVAWDAAVAASAGGLDAAQAVLAAAGRTVPSSEAVCEHGPSGVLVDIGILLDMYEGGVGGVFADGSRTSTSDLSGACRVGATQSELSDAAHGEWLVRGLGMGFEPPVIGAAVGAGQSLGEGMVLSVADGHHRDVVHLAAGGPEVLSGPAH